MLPALALAADSPGTLSEDVLEQLRARGVTPEPADSETTAEHLDRLDTALMALFRDSDDAAIFDVLYRHARGRLFPWMRWLVRQSRAQIDPLDLLQDTFVNAYRYAKSFRTDNSASFRCWVRTIASNVLRRELADRPRRALQMLPSGRQELSDPRSGPALRIATGEETALLLRAWMLFLQHYSHAFDALSPRDRRALELVEIEGRSYAEVGEILHVGPSNTKMIMLRSRRRLQAHMRRSMMVERPPARSRVAGGRRAVG